ncbi:MULTISPECIES: hypothetical protein [unclassified Agrococcus]|uniref:hypothetical protein n=1 Tax=unclassified Agrococcus TaxID=2615065 RepID=UPI003614AE71
MTRIAPAPLTPAIAVVAGLAAVTQGAIAVVGLALFVGTFVMVAYQEMVGSGAAPADIVSRASISGFAVVLVVGAIGEPLRAGLERALRMRQALRLARDGAPMLPAAERVALAKGALPPVRVALGIAGGVLATGALLAIAFGATEGHGAAVAIGLGMLVAGAAAIAGCVLLGRGPSARWADAVGELGRAWPRFWRSSQARTAPRRQAPVDRVLTILALAAFGVILLGLFTRQQCRTCDPVVYDPWGESVLDGVATVGLALAVLAIAAIAVRLAWVLVREAVLELVTLRRARAGRIERGPWLDGALGGLRSVEWLGRVLGLVAMAVLAFGISGHVDASFIGESEETLEPVRALRPLVPVGVALAVAAALVGILGAWAARAWRGVVVEHVQDDPSSVDVRRAARA